MEKDKKKMSHEHEYMDCLVCKLSAMSTPLEQNQVQINSVNVTIAFTEGNKVEIKLIWGCI